jgi:energy-coupling factor transport system ATP-binding protein
VNNINTRDDKQFIPLRKTIGIVFQNPENQIVFEKVPDDIKFSLKNLNFTEGEIESRIQYASKILHIESFTDSFELSMGQKQRAAIAGVLAAQNACIVFDEPTAMLDPKGKKDIHNIIVDLHKGGMTIVYVTNLIDEVLAADRILILDEGKIRAEYKRHELLGNLETLKELSLEIPVLLDIISRLNNEGFNIDADARTPEAIVQSILETARK